LEESTSAGGLTYPTAADKLAEVRQLAQADPTTLPWRWRLNYDAIALVQLTEAEEKIAALQAALRYVLAMFIH